MNKNNFFIKLIFYKIKGMLTKETAIFITIAIITSIVFSDKKNIKMVLPYLKSPTTNLIVIAVILLVGFIHIGYGILFAITYLFIYFTDMEIKRDAIFKEDFTSKVPSPAPAPTHSNSTKGYDDLLENRLKKETDSVKKASKKNVEDEEHFETKTTSAPSSGNTIEFQTLNLKILTNESNINSNTKEIKAIDDRVKKLEDQVKVNTLAVQKLQTTTGNPSDEDMKKLDKGSNEVKDVDIGSMIPK